MANVASKFILGSLFNQITRNISLCRKLPLKVDELGKNE